MLIQFSVENYRSINEEVTLSFEAASIRDLESECVSSRARYRILKSIVLYGANGSGKSNLLDAMDFYSEFVRKSSESNSAIDVQPYRLSIESEKRPSAFESVFFGAENIVYRYGFKVSGDHVEEEWLGRKRLKGPEAILFHRKNNKIKLGNFREGKNLFEKTRPNALFLSVCSQFNGEIAKDIVSRWTTLNAGTSIDPHLWGITAWMCIEDKSFLDEVCSLLSYADTGISKITCEYSEKPEVGRSIFPQGTVGDTDPAFLKARYKIHTYHPKFNKKGQVVGEEVFDFFENESEGTRKLFSLGGQALAAIKFGRTLIVDEFDAKFHPLLSKCLVGLFNSERNKHGAQLIIATHDTNLLEHGNFRRDQIWFTEKNNTGATSLYSLVEYRVDADRKVRKDASFERDYIQGRYGAIPYLGNFRDLIR